MTRIVLGNRSAITVSTTEAKDGTPSASRTVLPEGKRATDVVFPDEWSNAQVVRALIDADGILANHFEAGPAAEVPWVASDDKDLANLLASLVGGDTEVRDLEVPEPAPSRRAAGGAASALLSVTMLGVMMFLVSRMGPYLKVNAGHDHQAKQMAGVASATLIAKFMALTATATAPAATDTVLTGEIATAGGGLIRNTAAYAHTIGTNTYTLTGTFTANGTDVLPVTVAQMGVFDTATTGGSLVFRTLITPTATLSASGDVLTVTQTVTM